MSELEKEKEKERKRPMERERKRKRERERDAKIARVSRHFPNHPKKEKVNAYILYASCACFCI